MGSSLSKSHHHRNYWYEETGQVSGWKTTEVEWPALLELSRP